jgi:DNA-binding NarL/FixJ family response regulator
MGTRLEVRSILIVDDHPILREGIVHVLEDEEDLTVCGNIGSAEEALKFIQTTRPDLVLADLGLPGRSGIELIKDLQVLDPDLPVLVMSMHDELVYAERVLRAGGRGYVMKEAGSGLIVDAIRAVLDGKVFASRAVSDHFLDALSSTGRSRKSSYPLGRLTDRELEVFERIGKGENIKLIAESLHISPRTIDAHRTHIREKLGFGDSSELAVYAVRWMESGKFESPAPAPRSDDA